MTVRISTGAAASMLNGGGLVAYSAQTSGTLVVGRPYRIHAFVAGDNFTNVGAGSNATGVDFVATGTTPTTWTNASNVVNMSSVSGLREALRHGFINVYSGPQPQSSDTGATGTLLGTVSVSSGGTGLTFDLTATNILTKAMAEVWSFVGVAAGTAGWCRFYSGSGNPALTSTTAARIDAAIATSGSDVSLSNISVVIGSPHTVDVFKVTLPTGA